MKHEIFSAVAACALLFGCSPATPPEAASVAEQTAESAATPPATAPPVVSAAVSVPDPATAPATAAEVSDATINNADQVTNASIDTVLGDHTPYEAAIKALQQAVAAHDADGVAKLVDYPIDVEIGGKKMSIADEKAFVSRYSEFMTPEISKAIIGTNYSDLFVNAQGVMFGNGEAWINGICKYSSCQDVNVRLVRLQTVSE